MKELIEKLISRLEESEERYDDVSFAQLNEFGHTLDYEYAKGKRDGVAESIEIVNELAEEYNNEFCEWTPHDREIDVYFTQCGQAHIFCDGNPEENSYEFCPYCGKKIKVVE